MRLRARWVALFREKRHCTHPISLRALARFANLRRNPIRNSSASRYFGEKRPKPLDRRRAKAVVLSTETTQFPSANAPVSPVRCKSLRYGHIWKYIKLSAPSPDNTTRQSAATISNCSKPQLKVGRRQVPENDTWRRPISQTTGCDPALDTCWGCQDNLRSYARTRSRHPQSANRTPSCSCVNSGSRRGSLAISLAVAATRPESRPPLKKIPTFSVSHPIRYCLLQ